MLVGQPIEQFSVWHPGSLIVELQLGYAVTQVGPGCEEAPAIRLRVGESSNR